MATITRLVMAIAKTIMFGFIAVALFCVCSMSQINFWFIIIRFVLLYRKNIIKVVQKNSALRSKNKGNFQKINLISDLSGNLSFHITNSVSFIPGLLPNLLSFY